MTIDTSSLDAANQALADVTYAMLVAQGVADEEIWATVDRVQAPKWPKEYTNRETGRVYKPVSYTHLTLPTILLV